ncbi:MAG: copper resistance protein CopC [Chloroflexi bacterium]|nr:copper resistance protein CopC [Chloroflexota bacterium]
MTFRPLVSFRPLVALIGVAAFALAMLPFSPGGASDYLIDEEPPSGATVAEAPHQLLLTFDRPLAQIAGQHRVEVMDADGYRADKGQANISGYSLHTLVVPISVKGDGQLEVSYDVLLVDGDQYLEVSSSYRFSVDHSVAPDGGESIEAAAEKSSQALVLWTIAILLGIAVAGALVYFLRMATGNSRSSLEPTNRSVFRD